MRGSQGVGSGVLSQQSFRTQAGWALYHRVHQAINGEQVHRVSKLPLYDDRKEGKLPREAGGQQDSRASGAGEGGAQPTSWSRQGPGSDTGSQTSFRPQECWDMEQEWLQESTFSGDWLPAFAREPGAEPRSVAAFGSWRKTKKHQERNQTDVSHHANAKLELERTRGAVAATQSIRR